MKMRRAVKHFTRCFALDERGTQIVEMAIVLPVLLALFVVIVDAGRFFYTYTTLAKAVRMGARYMSVQPFNTTYQNNAKNLVVCGKTTCGSGDTPVIRNLTTSHVTITGYTCSTTTTCSTVTTSVPHVIEVQIGGANSYVFQPIFGGFLRHLGANMSIPVTPSITMHSASPSPSSAPEP